MLNFIRSAAITVGEQKRGVKFAYCPDGCGYLESNKRSSTPRSTDIQRPKDFKYYHVELGVYVVLDSIKPPHSQDRTTRKHFAKYIIPKMETLQR